MQTKIYCKTLRRGRQAFYANVNGKEYFMFEQDFRVSNKEFFRHGYYLTDKVNFSKARSTSVRKTLSKIPSYIKYIETEYGIAIYEKTKVKNTSKKKKISYKREPFLWQQYDWNVA